MLIGALAEATGVATRTLRFYEAEGLLLEPRRTAADYRDYDAAAVDRVRFVKQAQHAGLTLAQIREILAMRDSGETPCEHVAELVEVRLAEVEARLRVLRRTQAELRALKERVSALDPAECVGYCSAVDPAVPS